MEPPAAFFGFLAPALAAGAGGATVTAAGTISDILSAQLSVGSTVAAPPFIAARHALIGAARTLRPATAPRSALVVVFLGA